MNTMYNLRGDVYTMHTRKYSNGNTRVDFSLNDDPLWLLAHEYTVDEIYEIVKAHTEKQNEVRFGFGPAR